MKLSVNLFYFLIIYLFNVMIILTKEISNATQKN